VDSKFGQLCYPLTIREVWAASLDSCKCGQQVVWAASLDSCKCGQQVVWAASLDSCKCGQQVWTAVLSIDKAYQVGLAYLHHFKVIIEIES
jgi:hypothetical protein